MLNLDWISLCTCTASRGLICWDFMNQLEMATFGISYQNTFILWFVCSNWYCGQVEWSQLFADFLEFRIAKPRVASKIERLFWWLHRPATPKALKSVKFTTFLKGCNGHPFSRKIVKSPYSYQTHYADTNVGSVNTKRYRFLRQS